jgi:hypothetical protein
MKMLKLASSEVTLKHQHRGMWHGVVASPASAWHLASSKAGIGSVSNRAKSLKENEEKHQ